MSEKFLGFMVGFSLVAVFVIVCIEFKINECEMKHDLKRSQVCEIQYHPKEQNQ